VQVVGELDLVLVVAYAEVVQDLEALAQQCYQFKLLWEDEALIFMVN
jgi:hypothetical protein